MGKNSEILKKLLNESNEIVKFMDTHSYGDSLPGSKLRERYATAHFYISLDWYLGVVLLTRKQLYGSAFTLIRSMLESWIKGIWIRVVASDHVIEEITNDSSYWTREKKYLWVLRNEVKEKNEFLGDVIRNFLEPVDQVVNDCVHGNNFYLNFYLNKETHTLEPNFPDVTIIHMLNMANHIALSSTFFMKELSAQDEAPLIPFIEQLNKYGAYSIELLQRLRT